MNGSQLAQCAVGLARMGAAPSPAWSTRFWSHTQALMQEHRLSLADLSRLGHAAAEFSVSPEARKSVGRPSGEWLAAWQAAVEAASGKVTGEGGEAPAVATAVAAVLAAQRLEVQLPAAAVLPLLEASCQAAAGAAAARPDQPAAAMYSFGDVSGTRLAQLAPALLWMNIQPNEELLNTYIQVFHQPHTPPMHRYQLNQLSHTTSDPTHTRY